MRKVCVVTGTRAEYGLLYWSMKAIEESPHLELRLCVTGMHLSPEFGLTYQQIEKDGFRIDGKVEMLLSSDSPVGVSKSIGLGIIGFADLLDRLKPDLILVVGDRFETFSAVSAALVARIPVAHCHGGELTEGAIDEAIRHSITKMSHLHFTATEEYRQRVIQLGEAPERVFNVGALGIENIKRMELLDRDQFEKSIDFSLGDGPSFLVTFHSVTLDNVSAAEQFDILLAALDEFPAARIVFTKPNADTDGRVIIERIDCFVRSNPLRSKAFVSLGQLRYLSALKHMDVVIGNSSSGIIEAPSLGIPTVNIGDRQRGRVTGESVINCSTSVEGIADAIKLALTDDFKSRARHVTNPYDGTCNASTFIVEVLSSVSLQDITKKSFHNYAG